MMTLGMIEKWTEKGFKHISDLGMKAIELDYNVDNAPDELVKLVPELNSWSEKYDVKIGAIGRWGSDKIDANGNVIESELNNSYKIIDVCVSVGCPVFITGVNYIENKSFDENCNYAVDYLSKVVEYGKTKGIKVCCYNCDWNNFVREPKAWAAIVTSVDGLGIKYDPSHCITAGSGKYLEEINDWADRFYHFHIKGTIVVGKNHVDDPPAGLDMIDWRQIMGLLYAHNYSGMLSIEPHSAVWRSDKQGDWGIGVTKDFISPMIFNG